MPIRAVIPLPAPPTDPAGLPRWARDIVAVLQRELTRLSTDMTFPDVTDPAATTVSGAAGASYTGTEQTMLNALKTDVEALRATLLVVTNALQEKNG